jgi:predicted RNA binding protein YcfA (HicA-like mRNA interferase family)
MARTVAARGSGRGLTGRPPVCIYTHVDSATIIRILEREGWRRVGQAGSHVQFKHQERPGRVTVPHPKKDLGIGLVRSIERQSGVRLR